MTANQIKRMEVEEQIRSNKANEENTRRGQNMSMISHMVGGVGRLFKPLTSKPTTKMSNKSTEHIQDKELELKDKHFSAKSKEVEPKDKIKIKRRK